MASIGKPWIFLILSLFGISFVFCDENLVRQLSEDSWTELLEGEWLVKFYAPWCPACRSIAPMWETVAQQVKELDVNVAEVDVTNNPALSGRFFVVALPTIFHIKDGVFRPYKLARSEKNFYDFVARSQWKTVDPVPWYYSPTSIHMSFLGTFFRFSLAIKDIHTTIVTTYGIPVWASYAIFAIATILIGLLIGLLIVCLCDLRRSAPKAGKRIGDSSGKVKVEADSASDIDRKDANSSGKTSQTQDNSESTLRHRETTAPEGMLGVSVEQT